MGILNKLKGGKAEDKKEKKAPAKKPAAKKEATKKVAAKKPAAKKADKPAADKKPKENTRKKVSSGNANTIILRPHFTEKAERLQAVRQYTFVVAKTANKVEVARAIRELYDVKPSAVRMIVVKGKAVRFGKTQGKRKDEKRALVTLKAGDKITVMEGV